MIVLIARFLIAQGMPERRARQLAIGVLIVAVLIALWGAKRAYDGSVIERHDRGQAVEVERADRAADAGAAVQRRTDDARLHAEVAALEKVTDNASLHDPVAARRAYYQCVRVQQDARKLGRLTPPC
ncbi:MAG TPA: hypothetical protein VF463_10640 [Sphingobium sp.]